MSHKFRAPNLSLSEWLLLAISLVFSFWLMFHTFSYGNGDILVGGRLWSDFSSHIPVIRSFSFGSNFPPEYTLFPGEPMRFHFLFYALVGLLERAGVRIDYALNIPSALGFAGLMVMVYFFAKRIFESTVVGFLSVLFFLFNGSLTFLYFFEDYPLSKHTLTDIIESTKFASFGPYDNRMVSAFWNLNIFTNQRHLGLSYALALLLLSIFLHPVFSKHHVPHKQVSVPKILAWLFGKHIDIARKTILRHLLLGLLLSLFFYLHLGVFTFTVVLLGILALFFRELRFPALIILLIGAVFSIPQYLYQSTGGSSFHLLFKPGYLIFQDLTILSFLNYWFVNLGIVAMLMLAGFIIAPIKLKKIFLSFFSLFVIGNLFQFAPEIAGNHKFFNFFMLGGVMFAAYFLVYTWKKNIFVRPLLLIALFFSIFSGIIDFFPVFNDTKMSLPDAPKNKAVEWIRNNTPPESVFLNTSFLFDPASVAGRKVFLGWPYFAWSAGYDTYGRDRILKHALQASDKKTVCEISKKHNLSYLGINLLNKNDANFPPLSPLYQLTFPTIYQDDQYIILDLRPPCTME